MPINTGWQIQIGPVASPTTFTTRVLGLSVQQNVDVNVIGRGTARITLNNNDGALTPGGGGLYTSTDWFAQGVFINAQTDNGGSITSWPVFHGIIVDFEMVDDGKESQVTFTAVDGLTIAGRTPNITDSLGFGLTYVDALGAAFGSWSGRLQYPLLGRTTANASITVLPDPISFTPEFSEPSLTTSGATYSTAADLQQTAYIPCANDVLWATTISASGSAAVYGLQTCFFTNTRGTSSRVNFEFFQSGSVTGDRLPFSMKGFSQGFNNDQLITQSTVTSPYSGVTDTETAATLGNYGSRSVQFTQTILTNQRGVDRQAALLTNRYSTSRFGPMSLQVSAKQVQATASNSALSKWSSLLSISDSLWQRADVTWTGKGATSQTARCVIKGRKIDVTPDDAVITLELANWSDNHGFILDSDRLDFERLG
jgi:hypothetical protein